MILKEFTKTKVPIDNALSECMFV